MDTFFLNNCYLSFIFSDAICGGIIILYFTSFVIVFCAFIMREIWFNGPVLHFDTPRF